MKKYILLNKEISSPILIFSLFCRPEQQDHLVTRKLFDFVLMHFPTTITEISGAHLQTYISCSPDSPINKLAEKQNYLFRSFHRGDIGNNNKKKHRIMLRLNFLFLHRTWCNTHWRCVVKSVEMLSLSNHLSPLRPNIWQANPPEAHWYSIISEWKSSLSYSIPLLLFQQIIG